MSPFNPNDRGKHAQGGMEHYLFCVSVKSLLCHLRKLYSIGTIDLGGNSGNFLLERALQEGKFRLVYWGLMPQQQPGSYQGGEMMMMKSVFWWRKLEYPEETTNLQQVTDETFHTYGLCPVRGLNLGCSGVKQSKLRHDESDALAH